MRRRRWSWWCLSLVLATVAAGPAGAGRSGFGLEDFLLVPLRVHLLTTPKSSALKTSLTQAGFERLLPELNRIWRPAGLQFYLESCVPEAAVPGPIPDHPAKGSFAWLPQHLPTASRSTNALNLYFVKQFSANGVYFPDAIIIKDTVTLRRVPGGGKEFLPRVIAHELGHALSLLHRQKYTNLMASGTTGIALNGTEIQQARFAAGHFRFIHSARMILKRAQELEREGQADEARLLLQRLAALPLEPGAGSPADGRLGE